MYCVLCCVYEFLLSISTFEYFDCDCICIEREAVSGCGCVSEQVGEESLDNEGDPSLSSTGGIEFHNPVVQGSMTGDQVPVVPLVIDWLPLTSCDRRDADRSSFLPRTVTVSPSACHIFRLGQVWPWSRRS